MNWQQAVFLAQARAMARRCRPDAQAARRIAAAEAEHALGYIVRAEVAGAAPPADAWLRLQRRLAADARRRQQPSARDATGAAWRPARPLMRPYVSQLGAAMLLLLAMLGTLLPGAQLPGMAGTPAVVPPAMVSAPGRPLGRVNRGVLIGEGTSD